MFYLDNINWYTSNSQRLLFDSACNQWVNYIMSFDLFYVHIFISFLTGQQIYETCFVSRFNQNVYKYNETQYNFRK